MPPADRINDPGQGAKKDVTDTDDFLAIGPALRIMNAESRLNSGISSNMLRTKVRRFITRYSLARRGPLTIARRIAYCSVLYSMPITCWIRQHRTLFNVRWWCTAILQANHMVVWTSGNIPATHGLHRKHIIDIRFWYVNFVVCSRL